MGILDKVRNLFTEEVEEIEEKPVRKETRSIDTTPPKRESSTFREESLGQSSRVEESKEKFVFPVYFDDKDFDDLEKPKPKEKPKEKPKKLEPYRGGKPSAVAEPKKVFKPSPIISPVYGVLDKNYHKDDITTKKESMERTSYKREHLTVDDIRNKAYGTLEDDLEGSLLGNINILDSIGEDDKIDNQDALEIFNDLDFDTIDEQPEKSTFDSLEKQVLLDSDSLDGDTEALAKQLEEQKKKLEEINQYISDNEVSTKEEQESDNYNVELENETINTEVPHKRETFEEENLNDSELFDLIDSMYEKRDEE